MKIKRTIFAKYGEKANRKWGHKIKANDGSVCSVSYPLLWNWSLTLIKA